MSYPDTQGDNDLYKAPKTGYQGGGNIIYEPVRVLSFTQRLNRLRYCCYMVGSLVFGGLLVALGGVLVATTGEQSLGQLYVLVAAAALILWMVYLIGLMVRRLHDLDRAGWWWLCIFIPLVNLVFSIYLLAAAPSHGINRFGTPNPPNSLIVTLVGGLVWVLSMLQYLAAFALLVFSLFAPQLVQELGANPSLQQQLNEFSRQLNQLSP